MRRSAAPGPSGSGPAGTGSRGIPGALTGRELLRGSQVVRFLPKGLPRKWDRRRLGHSQGRLARTLLLLVGQGRRHHSDATAPGHDPALPLATDRPGGHGSTGQGRVPAGEHAGHRHQQPAPHGPQRTAGQRVERLPKSVDAFGCNPPTGARLPHRAAMASQSLPSLATQHETRTKGDDD